ncbi:hypothetical protein DID75_00720 [Candidatus Marinamargulisbacteria bacterium SCGC AG-410-N11]|nr:hypothetical protein DID75_00720 [Candidatus Marinamargulisbacteria bacterium SCGC AG-410-N11]
MSNFLKVLIMIICVNLIVIPLIGEELVLRSDQLEVELIDDMKKGVASGNVTITFKDIVVSSPRANYKYTDKSKEIHLFEGVKIKQKDITVTCKEVYAYGHKKKLVLKKEVLFNYDNINIISEKADYDMQKQNITFLGTPMIKQGEDFIQSDFISVNLKTKKVLSKGNTKLKVSTEKLKILDKN